MINTTTLRLAFYHIQDYFISIQNLCFRSQVTIIITVVKHYVKSVCSLSSPFKLEGCSHLTLVVGSLPYTQVYPKYFTIGYFIPLFISQLHGRAELTQTTKNYPLSFIFQLQTARKLVCNAILARPETNSAVFTFD